MAVFRSKTIRGVTYTLDHLDPFTFPLQVADREYVVETIFRCHCFTEELKGHHTPDFHYRHEGELRAFSIERHTLSQLLPELVRTLGTRSVYYSQQQNYFFLKDHPLIGFDGPYLVFFGTTRAKKKGVDVQMNIESAYMKPGMADRASPVRFTTLIEATAKGRPVVRAPLQKIKRK